MKRKDAGEVSDVDLLDFTLSSPALKIRRLDTELAPIINEQGTLYSVEFGQSMPLQDNFVQKSVESSPIAIDELSSSVPVNEERALVLFNPNNNSPSLQSSIPFSLSPDSNFLSRFKNPVIWSNRSDTDKPLVYETRKLDDDSEMANGCLAVVPWVPSHTRHPPAPDMMVSDAMDVEDNCNTQQMPKQYNHHYFAASGNQDWNQWQQHCMIQQPPNHFSTPVSWLG